MILVTGAAGKTGKAIISALSNKEYEIRALIHREEQETSVRVAGADDIIICDMADSSGLKDAICGAQAVYHICPNMSPREVEYGRKIIEAAQWAGVERFVYHSVLHPQIQAMPHHWAKMRVEELLFESGLPFTIVQPAAYMQNLSAYWPDIVTGSLPIPYSADTRISMVDLQDVAEVATLILGNSNHEGATYELVGSATFTQTELAGILGTELGISVNVEPVPIEIWKQGAIKTGMGANKIDTLVSMFKYYDSFSFCGNSMVLGWILGREPTTFTTFLRRFLKDNPYEA